MATVDSTNYALAVTANTPSTLLDPGQWGGRVRAQVSDYTFAATASGTIVNLAYLPVGAVVLPGSSISSAALGASTSFTVGDASSAARYCTVADSSSAAFTPFETAGGVNNEIAAATQIITMTVAGTLTGAIKSTVLYSYA